MVGASRSLEASEGDDGGEMDGGKADGKEVEDDMMDP